jgi:CheY-like chemotaxis protein
MREARIMVVEDEGIVALDLQNRLESMGYEVPVVTAYGEEALRRTGEIHPDLILDGYHSKGRYGRYRSFLADSGA